MAAEKRRQQKAEDGPAPKKTPKKKAKAKASVKKELANVKLENPLAGLTADDLGDEPGNEFSMSDGDQECGGDHDETSFF